MNTQHIHEHATGAWIRLDMQHGHGHTAWIWTCSMDMNMPHGYGNAAQQLKTCSMDMDIPLEIELCNRFMHYSTLENVANMNVWHGN
jgi:hypothetical protein